LIKVYSYGARGNERDEQSKACSAQFSSGPREINTANGLGVVLKPAENTPNLQLPKEISTTSIPIQSHAVLLGHWRGTRSWTWFRYQPGAFAWLKL